MQETSNTPEVASVEPKQSWLRLWLSALVFLAVLGLTLAFALMPVPYVVQRPGPTVNVLGKQGDTQVLEFPQSADDIPVGLPRPREGTEDDGELRMVTVSEQGGPGSTLRGIDLVRAWLTKGTTIHKFSDLYDTEVTAEELQENSAAQMESSHSSATIAAMEYLGIPMDARLTVAGTSPGSDAEGKVEAGDILVSIETPDGTVHMVDSPSVPFAVMKSVVGGETVKLTVKRDGEEVTIPIVSQVDPADENPQGSKMGIYLTADSEVPIDVSIHLERIGGPSAGLIFSLGIIDRLTEGITGGASIAGTGAISFAGDVLAIGGVKQKMYGALRDGSDWFLVPLSNCQDVVGNEPEGLRVVPVSTLSEGVEAVETIAAGNGDELPYCPVDTD